MRVKIELPNKTDMMIIISGIVVFIALTWVWIWQSKRLDEAYQKALQEYRRNVDSEASLQQVFKCGKELCDMGRCKMTDVERDLNEMQYEGTLERLTATDTPELRTLLRDLGHWLAINYSAKYSEQSIANDLTLLFAGRSSPQTDVAQQIQQLADLCSQGAISKEEFDRGKAVFLGNSPDIAKKTIEILDSLYRLKLHGAISESEYNVKKWELLSGRNLNPK
ncbi:MAG: SHOCT domain-containing protein [Planctomycetaceae bacterium]|nr:SHOCT domain-containing protein [Planctomycetaceae bacterium]